VPEPPGAGGVGVGVLLRAMSAALRLGLLVIFAAGLLGSSESPAQDRATRETVVGVGSAAAPLVDTLVPLGFSPKGALALLYETEDDAVGGYLWSVSVKDLATDETLYAERWSPETFDAIGGRAELWALRSPDLAPGIEAHGIPWPALPADGPGVTGLEAFPLVRGGDAYTVEVHLQPVQSDPRDPVKSRIAVVSLRSAQRGTKEIGSLAVTSHEDLGFTTSAPQAVGAWLSPHEPRIAVVLTTVHRGWEGPPHRRSWVVLGAHLERGFR